MTHHAADPVPPDDGLAALAPRDRRSVVGHASHDLMSPLAEATVAELVRRMGPVGRLLDVGAGKGAFARRALLAGRAGRALCIERNPLLAAEGRARAEREGTAARLDWWVGDAGGWRAAERFGAVAVIGSSQALGGLDAGLAFAARHLAPGGWLVIGEPVWVAAPPAEYLAFLGTDGRETPTPEAFAAALERAGFRIGHRHRSTPDEWAGYEAPYLAALDAFAIDDGQRPFAAQARAFADMQARHGRACMGFEAALGTLG